MKRHNKRKSKSLAHFLNKRTKGEDYFVANLILPTQDDPCWRRGYRLIGDWEHVSADILDWTLREAKDINDAGQIVGFGAFNGSFFRAFLLTPVR